MHLSFHKRFYTNRVTYANVIRMVETKTISRLYQDIVFVSVPDFMYNGIVALPKSVRFGVDGPVFTVCHNGSDATVALLEGINLKSVCHAMKRSDGYVDMMIY